MNLRMRVLWLTLAALVMSGCVGVQDAEGWRYGQKNEFLTILKTDKYASICNQKALYQKVKASENSKLMTKLLVAYTNNLANSCIVNPIHTSRVHGKKVYNYNTYNEKVKASDIQMKLKAGQSIEQILKPYVPEYVQFTRLIEKYNLLKNTAGTSPEMLKKLRVNIERLKIMKPGIGKNYALVNIPEYIVRIIENDKASVKMAVVVGKTNLRTPIFSSDLSYITLNPQWSVPDSIARHEIIPHLIKDPNYLSKKRMVMRSSYDLNSKKLSPSSVNLRAYSGGKGSVPFKFIEVPSKRNGLGRVKFIFPNHHSVYMHDTQSKHLFKRKVRTYSHGCVRLAEPMKMLKYIAQHYTSITPDQLSKEYKSLKTHYVKIRKRLAVHTAYLTTYVEDDGTLLQFNDIYGYDKYQKLNF
jgi:hypothetical protein